MSADDFPKTPADFFTYAKKHHAEMVDLKFVDTASGEPPDTNPVSFGSERRGPVNASINAEVSR